MNSIEMNARASRIPDPIEEATLKRYLKPGVPYAGISRSAVKRREAAARGTGKLHQGRPGDIIRMTGRAYLVAPDGSFRRLRP